mmetsp:Transcript_105129/g.336414  ORF Transcript_105129/g.336414 Transcript_105129/m.336414 type:complete len:269 (+) Transcript_105129:1024-1830(+)
MARTAWSAGPSMRSSRPGASRPTTRMIRRPKRRRSAIRAAPTALSGSTLRKNCRAWTPAIARSPPTTAFATSLASRPNATAVGATTPSPSSRRCTLRCGTKVLPCSSRTTWPRPTGTLPRLTASRPRPWPSPRRTRRRPRWTTPRSRPAVRSPRSTTTSIPSRPSRPSRSSPIAELPLVWSNPSRRHAAPGRGSAQMLASVWCRTRWSPKASSTSRSSLSPTTWRTRSTSSPRSSAARTRHSPLRPTSCPPRPASSSSAAPTTCRTAT